MIEAFTVLHVLMARQVCYADVVFPQKTIDSRVPMRKISSSKWFL